MATGTTGARVYSTTNAYNEFSKLTNAANSAYTGAKAKMKKDDSGTFKDLQKQAKSLRESFLQRKADMNKQIASIKETYLASAANPKITELMKEYAEQRGTAAANLKTMLHGIVEYRKVQLGEYITQPMNAETLALLQGLQLRSGMQGNKSLGEPSGNISATEIAMVLQKAGGNYQSLAALKAIANANGLDFVLPVEPDNYLQQLDLAKKRVDAVIDEFDNPSLGYWATEFFENEKYEETTLGNVFSLLDEMNASIGENTAPNLYQLFQEKAEEHRKRLEELNKEGDILAAQQEARQLNELKNFANNNRDVLETQEQHRNAVMQQAEELLTGGSKED